MQEEEGVKDVEKDGDEGDEQEDYADEDVQAENATSGDDQVVHESVYCDGCKMSPLVGVRYKCLESVFPRIIRAAFANDNRVFCSSECPEYDLCSGCEEKGIHPASHRMLKIENPEQAEPLADEVGTTISYRTAT